MGWAGLGSLLVSQNKTKPSPCMVVCDHGHVWLQIAWALAGNSKHQIKLEIHKELATFFFFQSFHYFIYSLFHFPWSLIRLTGADLSDTLMDRMVKLYNQNSIINLYRNFITIYWKYGWEMFNIKWWVYENRF